MNFARSVLRINERHANAPARCLPPEAYAREDPAYPLAQPSASMATAFWLTPSPQLWPDPDPVTSDDASGKLPTITIEIESPGASAKVSSPYEPASRGATRGPAHEKLQAIGDSLAEVGAATLTELIVTPALCFAEAMDRLPESSRPSTVTMKFSLAAGAEGNLYIAKGSASGAIEITTTWARTKP